MVLAYLAVEANAMENDGVEPETMVILMEEKAGYTGREGFSAWPVAERSLAAA